MSPIAFGDPPNMLLNFQDTGLGDAVMFQIVLKHLAEARDQGQYGKIYLETHECFWPLYRHLVDGLYPLQHPPLKVPVIKQVAKFNRPGEIYWFDGMCPHSKAATCLAYENHVAIYEDLFCYDEPEIPAKVQEQVDQVIKKELPGDPITLIHYEGVSSRDQKDLTHAQAESLCRQAIAQGTVPLILDWHRRSPLPDGKRIFCLGNHHPIWTDARRPNVSALAALMKRSKQLWGIDSGPEHLAGAMDIPTTIFWTAFHPYYNYDLAENVHHLVNCRYQYAEGFGGERLTEAGEKYFRENYHHTYYVHIGQVIDEIPARPTRPLAGDEDETEETTVTVQLKLRINGEDVPLEI